MKAGVSLFVAALAVTGLAETAVMPNASGDLASDETWTPAGGEVVPHGVDTDWEFSTKDGSYTASGDLQAVSISWTKPTTIDLTGGPLRKVQLGSATAEGTQNALFPGGLRTNEKSAVASCGALNIKGGLWDLGGWSLRSIKAWNYGGNSQLVISDGAVMTNVYQLQCANKASGSRMTITGGSEVYVDNGNMALMDYDCNACQFELSGGSKLVIGNSGSNWGLFNHSVQYATNLITGAGTVLTNGNNKADTVTAHHTLLHVDDGAKVYLNGPYYCYDPSSNNEVRVTRGAELHSRGTFYFSYGAAAQNNRLFIGDGGVFRALSVPFKGVNNEICVSNGVWNCQAAVFQGAAKDCTFRVMGDDNTVALVNYLDGCGNRIVFDGATYDLSNGLYMSSSDACSNALEVIHGSVVTAKHIRFEVYAGVKNGFQGARLLVADRSVLKPNIIYVAYSNNTVIVDDATIRTTTDNNIAVMFGGTSAAANALHGHGRLVLKGRQPLLDATNGGTIYFRSNTTVRVEMPTNGFANAEQALVRAKAWSSDGTTTFEFAGLEEHRETLEKPATYTLFEYVDPAQSWYCPFGTDAEEAALQTAIAPYPRCRIFKEDGKVKLRVAPDKGLMLIIR